MKLSTERILTTHMLAAWRVRRTSSTCSRRAASGQPYDTVAFDARVRQAVADVVRRQAELGIDIINDGEQGKPGFVAYISERLAGFEAHAVAQQGPTGRRRARASCSRSRSSTRSQPAGRQRRRGATTAHRLHRTDYL